MATAVNFGRDVSCTTGLRSGRLVTGPRLVAEALFRRVTTRRGTLRGGKDEANYGINLTDYVGRPNDRATIAPLEGLISVECRKDRRVQEVKTTVAARKVSATETALDVRIEGKTALGPFALVLEVSSVTVTLVGLTPEAA